MHQNYTRVTYIKSYDTQEPYGEVSPDLAVPLVDVEAGEVDVISSRYIYLFLKEIREICKDSKEAREAFYLWSF